MDNQNIPRIIPVKAEKPHGKPRKSLHPNLPTLPSVTMLCSPIRTGKSTLISNWLLNESFFGQKYWDRVIIFSNSIHNCSTSRFLCKAFECHTEYQDEILQDIIDSQLSYTKEERPKIAIFFDDIMGQLKQSSLITNFVTRFRHFGVELILFSVQSYKGIVPTIRNNITDLLVGCPFGNKKQLLQIAEDFGDNTESPDKFLELYNKATNNERYNFAYYKLSENPCEVFKNFEEKIYP